MFSAWQCVFLLVYNIFHLVANFQNESNSYTKLGMTNSTTLTCLEGPQKRCHRVGEATHSLVYAPMDWLIYTRQLFMNLRSVPLKKFFFSSLWSLYRAQQRSLKAVACSCTFLCQVEGTQRTPGRPLTNLTPHLAWPLPMCRPPCVSVVDMKYTVSVIIMSFAFKYLHKYVCSLSLGCRNCSYYSR